MTLRPRSAIPVLIIWLSAVNPVLARQTTEPVAPQSDALTYPNTADGLHRFLSRILTATKSGDSREATTLVHETEIPNYKQWFYKTYAADKAESWVGPYEKHLEQNEKNMQSLFSRLAQSEGEISTRKVNDSPEPGKGMEWGMLQALKQPVDIYFAKWDARDGTNGPRGIPIGYFLFIEGKFRWDSLIQFGAAQINHGVSVQPKLIKHVSPVYPFQAAAKGLTGTVRVLFNVGDNGAVHGARALSDEQGFSADPILTKAAVDAVKQWRFEPGTVNGKRSSFSALTVDIAFPHTH